MQQIKCRAWDEENNRMIFWSLNDLIVRFGDTTYQFGVEDRPSPFFKWMLSSGLEDKNKKEIYGGDICIDVNDDFFEIKFDEGKFVVVMDGNVILDLCEVADDVEIIGNIHENPELLQNISKNK